MKKVFVIIGSLIVLVLGYWLVSPLFITKRVNEGLPVGDVLPSPTGVVSEIETGVIPSAVSSSKTIATGQFAGLAGHSAQGTAVILEVGGKRYLRLESDFKVTNGPDLFVHLGKNDKYASEARLGPLKGNEGSQNYEIPVNLNLAEYNEVWVWCRSFSVPFGKALLK